jgi:hypothetical protein
VKQYPARSYKTLEIDDMNARFAYAQIFRQFEIETIRVRVWREGRWGNPQNFAQAVK